MTQAEEIPCHHLRGNGSAVCDAGKGRNDGKR